MSSLSGPCTSYGHGLGELGTGRALVGRTPERERCSRSFPKCGLSPALGIVSPEQVESDAPWQAIVRSIQIIVAVVAAVVVVAVPLLFLMFAVVCC